MLLCSPRVGQKSFLSLASILPSIFKSCLKQQIEVCERFFPIYSSLFCNNCFSSTSASSLHFYRLMAAFWLGVYKSSSFLFDVNVYIYSTISDPFQSWFLSHCSHAYQSATSYFAAQNVRGSPGNVLFSGQTISMSSRTSLFFHATYYI